MRAQFPEIIKKDQIIKPTNGSPITVRSLPGKKSPLYYAKVFVKDDEVFAASTEVEEDKSLTIINLVDYEKFVEARKETTNGPILPEDHIKVTVVKANTIVGKFI